MCLCKTAVSSGADVLTTSQTALAFREGRRTMSVIVTIFTKKASNFDFKRGSAVGFQLAVRARLCLLWWLV